MSKNTIVKIKIRIIHSCSMAVKVLVLNKKTRNTNYVSHVNYEMYSKKKIIWLCHLNYLNACIKNALHAIHALRKKIHQLHLEWIVKRFLSHFTRSIDFQNFRITKSTELNRWNDRAFLLQHFLDDEKIKYSINSLNCEKLSLYYKFLEFNSNLEL